MSGELNPTVKGLAHAPTSAGEERRVFKGQTDRQGRNRKEGHTE